jgi:hypothetical protein
MTIEERKFNKDDAKKLIDKFNDKDDGITLLEAQQLLVFLLAERDQLRIDWADAERRLNDKYINALIERDKERAARIIAVEALEEITSKPCEAYEHEARASRALTKIEEVLRDK